MLGNPFIEVLHDYLLRRVMTKFFPQVLAPLVEGLAGCLSEQVRHPPNFLFVIRAVWLGN